MADKTINQLAANGTLDGTELIPIWQTSTTVKLTIDDLGTYLGVGGATAWGAITGTLSSQTDLQTALDTKQPDLQFQNEGSNIGTSGGVSTVDFVGDGVTAAHSAGKVTVTIAASGSGGGTVTSVGLSMPSIFSVSNSPITTSGTIAVSATDPGADRIMFWDDSAGALAYLTVGSGLSLTGTTLESTASGGTVTSVALSGGTTGLSVSGSPITTSGTMTLSGTLAVANGGTGSTTAAGARTALGLGTIATQASSAVSITGGAISGITDLAVADGGTGASTAANARTNLGLGTWATKNQTASTSAASGTPADGDVWLQYTA